MVAILVFRLPARADEGMWMPFLIDDKLYEEMSRMGLKLEPEQIFSFTQSSIKDAIVSFGGFCTGEMISDQGLVLTNHHCGRGRIQTHSSVENDLLTDGFWAMTREDELPNPGLFVRFLVNVVDVTDEVKAVLHAGMTEGERTQAIRAKSQELTSAATEGTHYTANVSSMFAGNYFYLFTYETFTDVRLVGAPPQSIGGFGGDTDNWEWPRHTGDFALFRVYTAPDGSPAGYAEENIPLQPRHHLPISIRGVQENDFAMVLGYSGSTERYLTSFGIDFRLDYMYPVRIDIRRRKLDIMEAFMAGSDEIRIQYASKHSGISNYWKNFIGMSESLQRLNVADSKRELEQEFDAWVAADRMRQEEYGHVINDFREVYEQLKDFNSQNYVFAEAMNTGPDAVRTANRFVRMNNLMQQNGDPDVLAEEIERQLNLADAIFRNYNEEVDRNLWAAMFDVYQEYVPQEDLPDVYEFIFSQYGHDFEAYAADAYDGSIFSNAENLRAFLENPEAEILANDPIFVAVQSVFAKAREVNAGLARLNTQLQRAERYFLKGLLEMKPDELLYPDANSTMRFTYGTINGYHPRDAVYYEYYTTIEGVMEKKDPDHHEFVVPDKLVELYNKQEYGPYATEGQMVVNFISNNDITGGNSGSPVLNAEGHLIGVAFDANWEGMSGDILFEHELQKCINVDARYILFVIDKFAGATHLIEEMTIVR